MFELLNNQLTFLFPQAHQKAVCHIDIQPALRIPYNNRGYPHPGPGQFPVEHIDQP